MTIQINGTSGISGVDGSAATPALQGSDSNTGISFGTDTVNVNTGGSTRATVDSSGRLLVGTSTASATSTAILQGHSSSSTAESIFILSRSSVSASGDTLGQVRFSASNGANDFARIEALVDGTPGTSDYPGRLVFSTTADGASSPTERMRLDSSGNLKFNSGYGSVATAYGCRAWVNFNGTSTVAIHASGNVSSITDNGTGNYQMNFTNAMPDANYALVGTANDNVGLITTYAGTYSTTTAKVDSRNSTNGVVADWSRITVAVFR